MKKLPKKFLVALNAVKAKRPSTVIQHILKYGQITSQELKDVYGYNHPPRAIRDVKEQGIPIVSERITGNDGRSVAVYKFGNPQDLGKAGSKSTGRTVLSKTLKQALVEKYGARCFIYLEKMDEKSLQVDHRVPFDIGGECDPSNLSAFMLLCPSANRAKSWTCEHCENWERKDPAFCMKCFWANPESYEHVAGRFEKIVTIVFTGNEIEDYNKLVALAGKDSAQSLIKRIIHESLN